MVDRWCPWSNDEVREHVQCAELEQTAAIEGVDPAERFTDVTIWPDDADPREHRGSVGLEDSDDGFAGAMPVAACQAR